ncbi:MAG TPA: hypothetical protein VFH48_27830 [Chloroflexota bacterium]|nr:hypothetical protein [Chloroflexota bacterium]
MNAIEVQVCQCPPCQAGEEHPDRRLHEQMNLLLLAGKTTSSTARTRAVNWKSG